MSVHQYLVYAGVEMVRGRTRRDRVPAKIGFAKLCRDGAECQAAMNEAIAQGHVIHFIVPLTNPIHLAMLVHPGVIRDLAGDQLTAGGAT